ncbi:MAG: hypothetical protein C0609_06590 [Deltaproteobacteria bacterium]|nr:MAG: hypothetical protein C0609_06590 [Deltaproteobacteria bacterium]
MKIGVISDTHLAGVTPAFTGLLNNELGEADIIVHAGDHVGAGIMEYLEFMDRRPYYGVAGNMDPVAISSVLPREVAFEAGGLLFGVIHGWGPPSTILSSVKEHFAILPDVVIFGHSHLPLVEGIEGTLFVNPGSAFDKRFAPSRTAAIIDVVGGEAEANILELGK